MVLFSVPSKAVVPMGGLADAFFTYAAIVTTAFTTGGAVGMYYCTNSKSYFILPAAVMAAYIGIRYYPELSESMKEKK